MSWANCEQEGHNQGLFVLLYLAHLRLHFLDRFVGCFLFRTKNSEFPRLVAVKQLARVNVCSFQNQGLSVLKALRNVKVAAIPDSAALLPEDLDWVIRALVKWVQRLDYFLDDACLQDVRNVDPFSQLGCQRTFAHALRAADED